MQGPMTEEMTVIFNATTAETNWPTTVADATNYLCCKYEAILELNFADLLSDTAIKRHSDAATQRCSDTVTQWLSVNWNWQFYFHYTLWLSLIRRIKALQGGDVTSASISASASASATMTASATITSTTSTTLKKSHKESLPKPTFQCTSQSEVKTTNSCPKGDWRLLNVKPSVSRCWLQFVWLCDHCGRLFFIYLLLAEKIVDTDFLTDASLNASLSRYANVWSHYVGQDKKYNSYDEQLFMPSQS